MSITLVRFKKLPVLTNWISFLPYGKKSFVLTNLFEWNLHEDYAVYIINDYQLVSINSYTYLNNHEKGARITSDKLSAILTNLKKFKKLEMTEEQLLVLAEQYQVEIIQLKKVLITQLKVLKPLQARKFPTIYLNIDDDLIIQLLTQTLESQYQINLTTQNKYEANTLVIFYRQNYSSDEFHQLYYHLPESVYLITSGVIHQLLIIDNLYYHNSGLPTHTSNLQQLTNYLRSDIPATKNNWLLYYRDILKQDQNQFPDSMLNVCQRGYIAYCLHQFASQYTDLWQTPTPLDQINWFWHVDLTSFNIYRDAAIHSPLSLFDMKLDLNALCQNELVE